MGAQPQYPRKARSTELPFELIEREIRRRSYGILSTVSREGRPHSTGVLYGVSARNRHFALFVLTDRRYKKARDIAVNDNVSFTIPITRRLPLFPPNSIQFQGRATLLPLTDEEGKAAFGTSLLLRRTLSQLSQKTETSTFIRINPNPILYPYGIGFSLLNQMQAIGSAKGRSEVPLSRRGRWPR